MKRVKKLLIVLAVNIVWGSCWVGSANAGVITLSMRTTMDQNVFSNNSSWDPAEQTAGELLGPAGVTEYLSAEGAPVAFGLDQSEFFWEAESITAWQEAGGIWQLADASVNFGTQGYAYNTLTTPRRLPLFRSPRATWKDRDNEPPTPTPEPGTLALMLCGGLAAVRKLRSRRS